MLKFLLFFSFCLLFCHIPVANYILFFKKTLQVRNRTKRKSPPWRDRNGRIRKRRTKKYAPYPAIWLLLRLPKECQGIRPPNIYSVRQAFRLKSIPLRALLYHDNGCCGRFTLHFPCTRVDCILSDGLGISILYSFFLQSQYPT